MPGGIKNALDWIVGWGEVADRPVALFNTSEYGEHAKAALAEILVTMSLHIVPEAALTIHLRGSSQTKPGGCSSCPRTLPRCGAPSQPSRMR